MEGCGVFLFEWFSQKLTHQLFTKDSNEGDSDGEEERSQSLSQRAQTAILPRMVKAKRLRSI